MKRLWARLRAWLYRRFHRPDRTWLSAWPMSRKTGEEWSYCSAMGHKWGGWRRIGRKYGVTTAEGAIYTRRCRRRRCPAEQSTSDDRLFRQGLAIKGGQMWRVSRG